MSPSSSSAPTPPSSKRGRDRKTLGLTGNQEELVKAVMTANPRTVVVQMSAGPLTVPWLKENVPAMLQAWWPGEEGGHAIADVLFGEVTPGRPLPHTVYASEAQVPPLYPFGHGLSYTTLAYSNLRLSEKQIPSAGTVTVDLRNSGERPGDEVAQLYVHEVTPLVKRTAGKLAFWDEQKHAFTVNPGAFDILIGASSDDIRATDQLTVVK